MLKFSSKLKFLRRLPANPIPLSRRNAMQEMRECDRVSELELRVVYERDVLCKPCVGVRARVSVLESVFALVVLALCNSFVCVCICFFILWAP